MRHLRFVIGHAFIFPREPARVCLGLHRPWLSPVAVPSIVLSSRVFTFMRIPIELDRTISVAAMLSFLRFGPPGAP
jgi:hypothetical protein